MKLIVDVPDEEYNTLSKMSEKEKVNELSYYEKIIANGTPYEERPQGDLISRSELRKALHDRYAQWGDLTKYEILMSAMFETFNKLIDNAPTIDFEKLGESLNCQIRAHYGSCDDCELSCPRNELIKLLGLARPHGEWIKWNFKTFGAMGDWEYKCSNCEKVYGGEYNFCPNCGADMRKTESARPDTLGCFNCKHNGKGLRVEPCCFCNEQFSEWKAKYETDN